MLQPSDGKLDAMHRFGWNRVGGCCDSWINLYCSWSRSRFPCIVDDSINNLGSEFKEILDRVNALWLEEGDGSSFKTKQVPENSGVLIGG